MICCTVVAVSDAPDRQIGSNIARMRASRGMSQTDLGDRIGMHQQTVAKVEAGTRPLKLREASEICQVLNVTLDDMAAGPVQAGVRAAYRQRLTALSHQRDEVKSIAHRIADTLIDLAYTEGLNRVAPDYHRVDANTTRHAERWLATSWGEMIETAIWDALSENPKVQQAAGAVAGQTIQEMLSAVKGSITAWQPTLNIPGYGDDDAET